MPNRLIKCSVCKKHTLLLRTKYCSHCGEGVDSSEIPTDEEINEFFEGIRKKIPEENCAELYQEEKRNIEWARKHQAKRPARTVVVEEIEERFVWHLFPLIPSLFSGFYTNDLNEHSFMMKLGGGVAAGLIYMLFALCATDIGFKRLTGTYAIIFYVASWSWFYFWAGFQSNLAQAMATPVLFLLTVGRLMFYIHLYKKVKA